MLTTRTHTGLGLDCCTRRSWKQMSVLHQFTFTPQVKLLEQYSYFLLQGQITWANGSGAYPANTHFIRSESVIMTWRLIMQLIALHPSHSHMSSSSSGSRPETANCAARVKSASPFECRVSSVLVGRDPQPTVGYSILQACAILCTISRGLKQSYFSSSVSHHQPKRNDGLNKKLC